MSKEEFGRRIGMSRIYVGKVERGERGLSVDNVIRLCRETGVSADYILLGTFNPDDDPVTRAAVAELSREQIHIALDLIKRVADFIKTDGGNCALVHEVARQMGV